MKSQFIYSAAIALLLSCGSMSAMASTGKHTSLYGDFAAPSAADRTVNIGPGTKFVNVKAGETVQFVSNGKAVTWFFDNPTKYELKLRKIMTPGALDHKVMVYVERNPYYHTN